MPLRTARIASATAALAAAAALVPAAASAEPAAGLTGTADLVLFDTASPGALNVRPITGLETGAETAIGLDMRPATGQLFLFTAPTGSSAGVGVRSYVVDPATASAALVGVTAPVTNAGDRPSGVDINPVVDRARVVQSNGENFRVNPNNGSLTGNDTDLIYMPPATGPVTGVAFDRNIAPGPPGTIAPPGTFTTLYGIDTGADRLVTIGGINGENPGGSANGGNVLSAGVLGVAVDDGTEAGFDIAPNGAAFATLTVGGQPGLYRISLAPAGATPIGALPAEVRSLTITGPDNCPTAAGDQADQDGDGLGDVCDADIDGDGVSNDAEGARGSDPRKADTDGDGVGDAADACPAVAGTNAGCAAPDTTGATVTIGRTASRMKRAAFLKGVSGRISANEPVKLEVALLGKARSVGLARSGDVVLAEKNYALSAAARSVKLKPKRSLVGRKKSFTVRLRVIATDAAGNRSTKTKTIRVR